jgi:hypothetical protein
MTVNKHGSEAKAGFVWLEHWLMHRVLTDVSFFCGCICLDQSDRPCSCGSHPGPVHSPSPTCYTKHEINNSGQDKAQSPSPASGAYDIDLAIALH